MSARADITRRRLEQLEAVVEAARDLLDVTDPDSFDGRGMCAVVLADRLDDLDAYCERCDDEGVIVRVLGGEPTSPPPVTETPCECVVARVIAAKRRADDGGPPYISRETTAAIVEGLTPEWDDTDPVPPCLDCLRAPCRCALDEAGDLEDQIDHLLDEAPRG